MYLINTANHRCRVDNMYAGWCYCASIHSNPELRFILKDQLRGVPFLGWCMQVSLCL